MRHPDSAKPARRIAHSAARQACRHIHLCHALLKAADMAGELPRFMSTPPGAAQPTRASTRLGMVRGFAGYSSQTSMGVSLPHTM